MDWNQVKILLSDALAAPPAERTRYLTERCGNDGELRAEVERLLGAHEEAGAFLEQPVLAVPRANTTDQTTAGFTARTIGPYRIVSELGRGGMGVVYLAERADGEFRKQVAIKLLHERGDDGLIVRFRQERQILADLEHPNVARLLDGGTVDGAPYVVMEYVEGRNLRAILKERGALPLDRILEVTRQLCAGLGAAHARGIVHRDIKPENILVVERDQGWLVKVLDFGIARSQGLESADNPTQTGVVIGTAAYMSPEQALGATHDQIDARSDIYSAGMVIYELLTGEVAFKGASPLSVLNKQIHEQPAPPSRLRPDAGISAAVERVVLRALSKQREQRQQSAAELAAQFAQACEQKAASFPFLPWRQIAKPVLAVLTVLLLALLFRQFPSKREHDQREAARARPAAVGLSYRVLRQRAAGEAKPLAAGDFLRDGDVMHVEAIMPFQGTFYLYQKNGDGSLVWANPLPDGKAQQGAAGVTIKAPERNGIPMGPTPGIQTYLAVYVPWATTGPTADVSQLPFTYRDGAGNVYFTRIPRDAAARTFRFLRESAVEMKDFFPQPEGVFTHPPFSLTGNQKVIHHEIVVEQKAP